MTSRLITLKSSDGEKFEVSREVIKLSTTVSTLLSDLGMDDDESAMNIPIPLPKVDSAILKLVLKWCEHHKGDPPMKDDENVEKNLFKVPQWDQDFFKEIPKNPFWELTLAANYLDIKLLLEYCAKTMSDMIKGKKAEEIRKMFNVQNDFTKEEEEEIKRDNAWCETN